MNKDAASANADVLAPLLADSGLVHRPDSDIKSAAPVSQSEKTLAGVVIGSAWDMVAGKADAGEARAERAARADEYGEIAADTIASIPKLSAVTGGIARSVLLIDISGQSSVGEIARGAALNFLQGAALNKVGRIATAESAVTKLVASRLGSGLTAEIATHAISGGGFGLVKSGLSERSWLDNQGNFSASAGLKNVLTGTAAGTLIGVPAGMAGMRMGRAVTLGLASQAESSAAAAAVQKFATAAGAGFASGSVFGGVDAAKSGKSLGQVLDSAWHGGMVGLVTGGFASGFDHAPLSSLSGRATAGSDRPYFSSATARLPESSLFAERFASSEHARDFSKLGPTDKMIALSDALQSPEARQLAYDRLIYTPESRIRIEDVSARLAVAESETRISYRLKDGAPTTYAQYKEALKGLKTEGEPLSFYRHFMDPFVDKVDVPMRVYTIEGHKTKIFVPEDYAKQLDEVRRLRRANDKPSGFDNLSLGQKIIAREAMKDGNASALESMMGARELQQYIGVYQAGLALKAHPFAYRALPEDLIPILDALPHAGLIKELHLLDNRHYADIQKAVDYEAPTFRAAATVGRDGVVELYQSHVGSALYNTTFHEWSHLSKWQSATYNKLFDLATVADHVGPNVDHKATSEARATDPSHEDIIKPGIFYPDLHSTRSQDENYAVSLGEDILAPDPNKMFRYLESAPVRGVLLSAALESHINLTDPHLSNPMSAKFLDRAETATQMARPYALGTLQRHMQNGTPEQKAAALQLMAVMGTEEQAPELLSSARDPKNKVIPQWDDTAAGVVMTGDNRTVAQHAFDAYIKLLHPDQNSFDPAMAIFMDKPDLRELARDNALRSNDKRLMSVGAILKIADAQGTPEQRAAAVELIKEFGGADKAKILLSMALQKDNDCLPRFGENDQAGKNISPKRTVAQQAYDAYIEASVQGRDARFDLAFKLGRENPHHRELASSYLINNWDKRAQGFGKFLSMYDLPGHTVKMQELIDENFRTDATAQKMIYDRMLELTAPDPRRQMHVITSNLQKTPALMDRVLDSIDGLLNHGTSELQREQLERALKDRMEWENYSSASGDHMKALLTRIQEESKFQEALGVISRGHGDKVQAVHELSVLHDSRAIKPLLQQAVSGNEMLEEEAIGALRQFSPSMVKFYAQELKRECYGNPTMLSRLSNLLNSHRFVAPPSTGNDFQSRSAWQ